MAGAAGATEEVIAEDEPPETALPEVAADFEPVLEDPELVDAGADPPSSILLMLFYKAVISP